jgi:hypothetical protein
MMQNNTKLTTAASRIVAEEKSKASGTYTT